MLVFIVSYIENAQERKPLKPLGGRAVSRCMGPLALSPTLLLTLGGV